MDTEATLATLWVLVGVLVPIGLIGGAVYLVGTELETALDVASVLAVVVVSYAWVAYCTWQVQVVSRPPKPDL